MNSSISFINIDHSSIHLIFYHIYHDSQIINETIPALQKLKEKGKIRFIGITGLPLGIFNYVLDRVPLGTIDVILSYCHYGINDTTLEDLLPYLKSKGVGVISASPLSMGLLTENGPPDWHPASSELKVFFESLILLSNWFLFFKSLCLISGCMS